MMRKTIAAAALVALLSACDGGADDGADGRTAEGEVLGGTISDEMLPFDTVKSQSPPLRTEPTGDAEDADAAGSGEGADDATEAPADEPAADEAGAEPEPEPAVPTPEISVGSEDGE